jgi:hypothetical protein
MTPSLTLNIWLVMQKCLNLNFALIHLSCLLLENDTGDADIQVL